MIKKNNITYSSSFLNCTRSPVTYFMYCNIIELLTFAIKKKNNILLSHTNVLVGCFSYWPNKKEFDLTESQKTLLNRQTNRNQELTFSLLNEKYFELLHHWNDNFDRYKKTPGWIDMFEYAKTADNNLPNYWDVLSRNNHYLGVPSGYRPTEDIQFDPHFLYYVNRKEGFGYSSYMRMDLIHYAKHRFIPGVYKELARAKHAKYGWKSIREHSWADVKETLGHIWSINRNSIFYENTNKIHSSSTYVGKIIARKKREYYEAALQRTLNTLKRRWVLLLTLRSPKAHGMILRPLPAYYLENHLRFLPEEFYYTRNPEYISGMDVDINSYWDAGVIWEPTEKYNHKSWEEGLRQDFQWQKLKNSNKAFQLKDTRPKMGSRSFIMDDFRANKRDNARIHNDIRQSVWYWGFWTQWAELQKGNAATSLKFLKGDLWPEKGTQFNWSFLKFWEWNMTFLHSLEAAGVSHSWYWSEIGLCFWLVGAIWVFEVFRHEITWRILEYFPKFAEWSFERRKQGRNMWQTNFFICIAIPILILVLGDFTTEWSYQHAWTAYDKELPFIDHMDRLDEESDWDDWDDAEWISWRDSFSVSYTEENYTMASMEAERPKQSIHSPTFWLSYKGYASMDSSKDFAKYANTRYLDSGTNWVHEAGTHFMSPTDIRGVSGPMREIRARWHHDRFPKLLQMLIANEPNTIAYKIRSREKNSNTEIYWKPWDKKVYGYDIPFGWYLDYDISWHYKLSEAFNSLYGNALGQTIVWFPGLNLERASKYFWRPTHMWRWNYSSKNRTMFDNIYAFYDFWAYGYFFKACFLSDIKMQKTHIKNSTYLPWRDYVLAGFGDNLLLWRDKKLSIPLPGAYDEDAGENDNILYGLTYGDYTYAHLRRKTGNAFLAINK